MSELCYESSDVEVINNLREITGCKKFNDALKCLDIGEAYVVKASRDGYPLVAVRLADRGTKQFYVRVIRDWTALQRMGWMPLDLPR